MEKFIALKSVDEVKNKMTEWSKENLLGLFIYNLLLMLLILLHSAGYFSPFFPITINIIVFIALVLAVFLLGARSKAVFLVTLFFWIFAGVLRILSVDVWAERTAVYAFEGLLLGVILQIWEDFRKKS